MNAPDERPETDVWVGSTSYDGMLVTAADAVPSSLDGDPPPQPAKASPARQVPRASREERVPCKRVRIIVVTSCWKELGHDPFRRAAGPSRGHVAPIGGHFAPGIQT
jgi:hypothetical protein